MTKKTPEQIESNRQYHLSFFKDDYQEKAYEWACLCMEAQKLIKKANEIDRVCKNIDANRRENAVHMGCTIFESDAVYDFDSIRKSVPELIEKLKEFQKQFGIESE